MKMIEEKAIKEVIDSLSFVELKGDIKEGKPPIQRKVG